MGSTILFDVEANGLLDEATKVHCIAMKVDGGDVCLYRDMSAATSVLDTATTLVAHNGIDYDLPLLKKLLGWDPQPAANIVDTLVLSRLAYPHMKQVDFGRGDACRVPKHLRGRHSLESWGHRLGIHKGDYDGGWAEYNEDMGKYCMQDVEVLDRLHAYLQEKLAGPKWQRAIELEHALQFEICSMERHGFLFDDVAALKLVKELREKLEVLDTLIRGWFLPKESVCLGPYGNQLGRVAREFRDRITAAECESWWNDGDLRAEMEAVGIKFKWTKEQSFNPSSEKQIEERLRELGWEPTELTKTGRAKLDADHLQEVAALYPSMQPVADRQMLQKRISQIAEGRYAWLKMQQQDGRIHGKHNTMGTVTYRFTHRQPNMSQVPACNKPYGRECRSLFTVPEGFSLVGCDASGLELRMLGHYLAPLDGGSFAQEVVEGDIHTANQEAAGLDTRDQAKTFIYAFLYGAGDGKLGSIVGGGIREGKALRRRFLSRMPALRRLQQGVKQRATVAKMLKGLDGRPLIVRSVHSSLNTLLQAGGSILVKSATVLFCQKMRRILRHGTQWAMVAHSHDEWQTEVITDYAEPTGRAAVDAIEQAGRMLGLRVPVTGEFKIGRSWAETH